MSLYAFFSSSNGGTIVDCFNFYLDLIVGFLCFELTGSRAMKNSSSEELDTYYPVRPECLADVPKTRFKARVC